MGIGRLLGLRSRIPKCEPCKEINQPRALDRYTWGWHSAQEHPAGIPREVEMAGAKRCCFQRMTQNPPSPALSGACWAWGTLAGRVAAFRVTPLLPSRQ